MHTFPISTVIKYEPSSADFRLCGAVMQITRLLCPKLGRTGNGSWPWHIQKAYSFQFVFSNLVFQKLGTFSACVLGTGLNYFLSYALPTGQGQERHEVLTSQSQGGSAPPPLCEDTFAKWGCGPGPHGWANLHP